jgi:hypothetical protein
VLHVVQPKTLLRAAALIALGTACSSRGPTESEVDYVGVLEGTVFAASGAPLDSVRILPVGAADDAIYEFRQALTNSDGRFSVTVTRRGSVDGDVKRLPLTVNVIATAFKGFNDNPDGPFPTMHVRVPMEFVPIGTMPMRASVEIRFLE